MEQMVIAFLRDMNRKLGGSFLCNYDKDLCFSVKSCNRFFSSDHIFTPSDSFYEFVEKWWLDNCGMSVAFNNTGSIFWVVNTQEIAIKNAVEMQQSKKDLQ